MARQCFLRRFRKNPSTESYRHTFRLNSCRKAIVRIPGVGHLGDTRRCPGEGSVPEAVPESASEQVYRLRR